MKILQKIIFTFAIVAGFSLAVSAQNDTKKPPPKDPPPVVTPQPKPPPQNPPSDSNKPKKPSFALFIRKNETGETV
ncbi:MAG: hypothetical protein ACKVQJ_13050 [Pyrinomonadaceae bacterium]